MDIMDSYWPQKLSTDFLLAICSVSTQVRWVVYFYTMIFHYFAAWARLNFLCIYKVFVSNIFICFLIIWVLCVKKAASKSRRCMGVKKSQQWGKTTPLGVKPSNGTRQLLQEANKPSNGQKNSFWRWTNPAMRQYNSFGRQTNPAMGRDNSFGRQTNPAMGWYNSFGNQTNPAVGNKIYLIYHTLWILPKLTVEHQIICANTIVHFNKCIHESCTWFYI